VEDNAAEFMRALERAKLSSKLKSNLLAEIHHVLMAKYGWIPYSEFKALPIPVVLNLLEMIRKEAELYEKELNKARWSKGI